LNVVIAYWISKFPFEENKFVYTFSFFGFFFFELGYTTDEILDYLSELPEAITFPAFC
jgi:hypothetical protein